MKLSIQIAGGILLAVVALIIIDTALFSAHAAGGFVSAVVSAPDFLPGLLGLCWLVLLAWVMFRQRRFSK